MRIILILTCLSACASFPALDGSISDSARAAPYPQLAPLPPRTTQLDVSQNASLNRRIAALNARAARLRAIDIGALQ